MVTKGVMNPRSDQVASVLQRAVQQAITQGLNDPRVRGLISVTEVKLSPDGAEATIMISVHPPEHTDLTMHGIRHAAKRIRADVAHQITMRRIPRLVFREDRSIKVQTRVLRSIQSATEGMDLSDPEHKQGDDRS